MVKGAVVLRLASASDAGVLAEFCARTFDDTYREFNTDADMAVYVQSAFNAERIGAELARKDCSYLMACDDAGTLVGYVQVVVNSRLDCVRAERCAEIGRLYADRSHQGQGLGAQLLKGALQHAAAEGCDTIWLAVWQQNTRARAFYAKWGFERVGTTTFQLGESLQDDFVLQRSTALD
jgi:diamine N-acetyltransferase